MPIHLIVILAATIAVCAFIVLVESKEKPTQVIAAGAILAAAWMIGVPYVPALAQYQTTMVTNVVVGLISVLAIVTAVRTQKVPVATMLISNAVLLAAITYGVIAV